MSKHFHRFYIGFFVTVGVSSLIFLIINGFNYYQLPLEQRVFSPDHPALKPSGVMGHGLGIIGSLMMIAGVSLYMIRKRYRALFTLGYLKYWLEFHIFMCTVGPVLVLFHTAFKFGGIVAVSFWSMVVVVLSGFAGRFIYVQIPRTIQGRELELMELDGMEAVYSEELNSQLRAKPALLNEVNRFCDTARNHEFTLAQSLREIFKQHFVIKRIQRELKASLYMDSGISKNSAKTILRTTKTKMMFSRKIGMLKTMQNLFRYWHIFHLPFALSMFIIMTIHVAVTLAFGYKWIF